MDCFPQRSWWKKVTLVAIVVAGGSQLAPALCAGNQPQLQLSQNQASQQLIVKFKPHTLACDTSGVAHLSADTQVPLEHVRAMSGDACVINQLADSVAALLQGQEKLKRHPAIEWLEEDRVMTPS